MIETRIMSCEVWFLVYETKIWIVRISSNYFENLFRNKKTDSPQWQVRLLF